jgi:hypothetical protein
MAGKNALWRFAIGAIFVPNAAERLAALATVRRREKRIVIMVERGQDKVEEKCGKENWASLYTPRVRMVEQRHTSLMSINFDGNITCTMPRAIISPSVLASDFGQLTAECKRMIKGGAEWLHMGPFSHPHPSAYLPR